MKFTEKVKRFFTLSAKHEGFTLVELIVVIAILAILAGVAVPAYSGYINKAQTAADQTLLSAVNDAFSSACVVNGKDAVGMTGVSIKLTDTGDGYKVEKVSVYNDKFFDFFEGNTESTFKTISMLYFDSENGVFTADASVYSALAALFSTEDKNAFNSSVFAELGAEELLGKIGQLTGFGAALIGTEGSTFYDLVWGDGTGNSTYMQTLASKMGYDLSDESDNAAFWTQIQEMGGDEEGMLNIFANGAVLSAASKTEGMDTSFLTSGNLKGTIQSNLNNADTAETGLAQSAMAYAMYMSYANSDAGKAAGVTVPELTGASDTTTLVNMLGDMNSEGFQTYMNSAQGQADLAGYQASMNMINTSATDKDALNSILVNGFDDPNLAGILNSVITAK